MIPLLACALAGACHKASSSGIPLLASSRIGPAGGVLLVESGKQDGLIMTVAPGVLSETVDFQVLDVTNEVVATGPGAVSAPPLSDAGWPFRIEPADLVLSQAVTLRIPYQPANIANTGPGNVELRQANVYTSRGYDPEAINATDGWIEVGIKTFGRFEVVLGPVVNDLLDYEPALGEVVTLTGGFEFAVEEDAPASPFATSGARQWRLTGPQFDERILMSDGNIVGRRSEAGSWLEVWSDPYSPYQLANCSLPNPQPSVMQVQVPIGALGIGASVIPFGFYQFALPL